MSAVAGTLPPIALDASSLHTVPDVARYLKMSRSMIYLLMERGELAYVKIGRTRRVKAEDITKLIELNSVSREAAPRTAG
jgi:excisionase family DNA binding protein